MTDVAAQREARRLKLLKNAENRMNRLKSNDTTEESKEKTGLKNDLTTAANENDTIQTQTTEITSPYNLRNRANKGPVETSDGLVAKEEKNSSVPYKIVDDPEVPSLAEFLATQEATKAKEGNVSSPKPRKNVAPPKTLKKIFPEKHLEYIKIVGLFVTALFSRWSLAHEYGEGIFFLGELFQSMFFPFVVFEVFLSFYVSSYLKASIATAPSGSLLTTALMLCGIKAELVQMYIRIMGYVTSISNDFFLYIFAFLMWHLVLGL